MTSTKKPVVGLLGSTGNLGSFFFHEIDQQGRNSSFVVKKIGRPEKISGDFNITPEGFITSREGEFPDVIVNLSNSYYPNPRPEQLREMETAILGVANAISNSIEKSGCSVISASTYFQYCPTEQQPWSHYSELKNTAKEIVKTAAESCGTNFMDFVLFDNYGGLPRNKFVDFLERSLLDGVQIDCTEGAQVLNLTHVNDLVAAFVSAVDELANTQGKGSQTYELKSQFTVSLRELVDIAERASGRRASINWGAIPYREKEVFELWETGFKPPSAWKPNIEFLEEVKMDVK
jgi:nucleoside-diphosphate-sugar epimerase